MGEKRFEKRIPSDLYETSRARAWLRGCLASLPPRGRHIAPDLELVLGELLTNSVRHAYGPGVEGEIDIEVLIKGSGVEMSIQDYGAPMDCSAYRAPDLREAHEGGYGVYLVRLLTDDYRVEAPGGVGNRVTVARSFRSVPRASSARPSNPGEG